MKYLLVLVSLLCPCKPLRASHSISAFTMLPWYSFAIIGSDNRHEWYEEKSKPLKKLGMGTAILLDKKAKLLVPTKSGYQFSSLVQTHGEYDQLCSDVRFREQLAPGYCTGSLVGEDLLVTSEHCVKENCDNIQLVFDFLYRGKDRIKNRFSLNQVYSCHEVVSRNVEEDWAIIRLDRPVKGRKVFKIRQEGKPEIGTALTMLGYPRGIPLKIVDNATVVKSAGYAPEEIFFEADLDSFGGNSGSPIVNAKTLELEGILSVAFGEFEDEEMDPKTEKPCRRLRTYHDPEEAMPVWATRATRFVSEVHKALR